MGECLGAEGGLRPDMTFDWRSTRACLLPLLDQGEGVAEVGREQVFGGEDVLAGAAFILNVAVAGGPLAVHSGRTVLPGLCRL